MQIVLLILFFLALFWGTFLAFMALPGWFVGMCVGLVLLVWVVGRAVAAALGPNYIHETVEVWLENECLKWHAKAPDGLRETLSTTIDFVVGVAAVAASVATAVTFSYLAEDSADRILYVVLMVISGGGALWCMQRFNPVGLCERWINWRLRGPLRAIEVETEALVDLRSLAVRASELAESIGVAFDASYLADTVIRIQSDWKSGILDPLGVREEIDRGLTAASSDVGHLSAAASRLEILRRDYLGTAREVNRSGSISLLTECDYLGAGLEPSNLPRLLSSRMWAEFDQAAELMAKEMVDLRRRAAEFSQLGDRRAEAGRGPGDPPVTIAEALAILDLSENATFEEVKSRRRELVKLFNIDQRQDLEPHIKRLVEERFKVINAAFDVLSRGMEAT